MFSDPKKNIGEMFVAEGMTVADFGAGSGFYSLALADKVGPYGMVHSIDIIPENLSKLQYEAEHRGLKNINLIHTDLEGPQGSSVQGMSADRVVVSNILFQTDHPEKIVKEAKRILKHDGKVAVIEWISSLDRIGPHPDNIMSKQKTIDMFVTEGFELEKDFDAGSHHYGLLFTLKA
jgi:ubiquinone/menaquinone biosynthesis C-methylase UbiE